MVRFSSLFNPRDRTVTFLNGQTYPLPALQTLGMGSLLNAMFDFSEKLDSLSLESDEIALFMAVVLVSAGKHWRGSRFIIQNEFIIQTRSNNSTISKMKHSSKT